MNPRTVEPAIGAALTQAVERVSPAGAGRWSFELVNGRRLAGLASCRDDWLELRVPLPDRIGRLGHWELLRQNGHLPGVARLVRHDHHRIALHGDVPIGTPGLLGLRIAAACAALRKGEAERSAKGPLEEPAQPAPNGEPAWERLGEEAGWRLTRREDGRFAVELDVPGLMSQAFLDCAGGEWVLSLELLRSGGLSPSGRRAIGLFLLGLTGRLRMVRAAITRQEPEAVRLEVALPEPAPTAAELDAALEALSLACRLSSREVRALGQEPLAGIYLAHTLEE